MLEQTHYAVVEWLQRANNSVFHYKQLLGVICYLPCLPQEETPRRNRWSDDSSDHWFLLGWVISDDSPDQPLVSVWTCCMLDILYNLWRILCMFIQAQLSLANQNSIEILPIVIYNSFRLQVNGWCICQTRRLLDSSFFSSILRVSQVFRDCIWFWPLRKLPCKAVPLD